MDKDLSMVAILENLVRYSQRQIKGGNKIVLSHTAHKIISAELKDSNPFLLEPFFTSSNQLLELKSFMGIDVEVEDLNPFDFSIKISIE